MLAVNVLNGQRNTANKVIKKHGNQANEGLFFLFALVVVLFLARHRHHSIVQRRRIQVEKRKRQPQSPLRKWRVINVRAIKQIGI